MYIYIYIDDNNDMIHNNVRGLGCSRQAFKRKSFTSRKLGKNAWKHVMNAWKKLRKWWTFQKKNKVLMKKTCEFFKSLGRNLSKTSFHWRFCAQQRKARLQSFEGEGLHNSQRHSGLLNRLNKLNLERNEPSEPRKKAKNTLSSFFPWNTEILLIKK